MLKVNKEDLDKILLGKRVDYSGRSVIVVGPDLKITWMWFTKKNGFRVI